MVDIFKCLTFGENIKIKLTILSVLYILFYVLQYIYIKSLSNNIPFSNKLLAFNYSKFYLS